MEEVRKRGRPRKNPPKLMDEEPKARGRPKKEAKPPKEPKKKLYFGIDDPPKGYRQASMEEAVNRNKVLYFGVKKVDSRLLDIKRNDEQVIQKLKDEKFNYASLLGKQRKIQRDLNNAGTDKLKRTYTGLLNEVNNDLKNKQNNILILQKKVDNIKNKK